MRTGSSSEASELDPKPAADFSLKGAAKFWIAFAFFAGQVIVESYNDLALDGTFDKKDLITLVVGAVGVIGVWWKANQPK